jgi:hypothetical protein
VAEQSAPRTPAARLLDSYNHLDRYMRKRLNARPGAPHVDLIRRLAEIDPVFSNRKIELEELARLRNAIVHTPEEPDGSPIAEPHEDAVQRYQQLVSQVFHPALAKQFGIPAERIFTAKMDRHGAWCCSRDETLRVHTRAHPGGRKSHGRF